MGTASGRGRPCLGFWMPFIGVSSRSSWANQPAEKGAEGRESTADRPGPDTPRQVGNVGTQCERVNAQQTNLLIALTQEGLKVSQIDVRRSERVRRGILHRPEEGDVGETGGRLGGFAHAPHAILRLHDRQKVTLWGFSTA